MRTRVIVAFAVAALLIGGSAVALAIDLGKHSLPH
jgi:hypothetical protein